MRSDGTHTENDKERADTFAASLEKVHNVHQGTIFDDEFKVEVESTIKEHEMLFKPLVSHVPEENDDHETLTPITTGEIKAYLKKCKSSSAPGLDGIRYGVLKQANDTVYEALAKSVMLVWLQDTILSYGKRLKVSWYLSQAKTEKCRGTIGLSACWAVWANSLKKR